MNYRRKWIEFESPSGEDGIVYAVLLQGDVSWWYRVEIKKKNWILLDAPVNPYESRV